MDPLLIHLFTQAFWFGLLGAAAGVLAGLFGIGGGLIIVPALTALWVLQGASLDVAVPMAVASSLASILLTSLGAIRSHAGRGSVVWASVRQLAPACALGALLGAWLASQVDGQSLARLFALIALLIAGPMIWRRHPAGSDQSLTATPTPRLGWLFGPLIGLASALAGIGGGSFNVPYLLRHGHSMVSAVGTASAIGWPIALAGVLGFVWMADQASAWPGAWGYVHGPAAILIGITGAITAPIGVRWAHRLPAARLRRLFGLLLCLVALRMAW